nr:hypothetical protein [Tanacetum cinerariifolium]
GEARIWLDKEPSRSILTLDQNLVGRSRIVNELMEHIPVLMIERVIYTMETDMVIHTGTTKMMRLVVEIECVGKIADAFDKATGPSDGLQTEQVDLNYVHALNEPLLHQIRVVPSKHEADQHLSCADPLPV